MVGALNIAEKVNEIIDHLNQSEKKEEENPNEGKGGPCHIGVDFHEACEYKGCVCECHQPSEPKSTETMYSVGRLCGVELWIDGTAEMANSVMERLRKLLDAQPSEPKRECSCMKSIYLTAKTHHELHYEPKHNHIYGTLGCSECQKNDPTEDRSRNDVN